MAGVMFLTNNDNAKGLYEWIAEKVETCLCESKLTLEMLESIKPDLVISYNYKHIVSKECIDYMNHRIINIHISMLPWNRGAGPNLWSFVYDTPKGVTIHEMTPGLDEGDIIFQQEMEFDENTHTLSSSYEALNRAAVKLFKEHWQEIWSGNYSQTPQSGQGSYHAIKDIVALRTKVDFDWTDTIAEFRNKIKNINLE